MVLERANRDHGLDNLALHAVQRNSFVQPDGSEFVFPS